MPKIPFKPSTRRATKILELVHSDISGPMRTPTPEGHRFAINFVDDASRLVVIYLMKNKSEALQKLKEFETNYGTPQILNVGALKEELNAPQSTMQNESSDTSPRLRALRTDNGGEYISREFTKYCQDRRIKRELTIARTPEQNGVAERNWRTLFDMVRSMLNQGNMEPKWWGRALVAAAYTRNRCLTNGLKNNQTHLKLSQERNQMSAT
jgi:transposase InsO family protein